MKAGSCPLGSLEGHGDDDDKEHKERRKVPRGVPGRKRQLLRRGSAVAEAEAIVVEYQETIAAREPVAARGYTFATEPAFKWIGEGSRSTGERSLKELFALAMAAALVGGTGILLGHGLKVSLGMAQQLEMQLSGLVSNRSAARAKGAAGKGFYQDWSGFLSGRSGSPVETR